MDWNLLNAAKIASAQTLRRAAEEAQLSEASPENIIPQHDESVLFVSGTICNFKDTLLTKSDAPSAFVLQWCFRDRSFEILKRGETPKWGSCFRQFGTIAPTTDLRTQFFAFHQHLLNLTNSFGASLRLNANRSDIDIVSAGRAARMSIDFDTHPIEYYKHRYGHDRLCGRNANFSILQEESNSWTDIGNIIIIERDGRPFALEIAIGIETLAATLCGKTSAVWASAIICPEAFDLTHHSLATIDILNTVLHLHASGLRPFATNRGRIFRRYLNLLCTTVKANSIDPAPLIEMCAEHVCRIRSIPFIPGYWSTLIAYVKDRAALPDRLSEQERNTRIAVTWARRWPHLSA